MKKEKMIIAGAGGGGNEQPRQPVEMPDNVESKTLASILDLLGEGVIGGLKNGGQSVFLDNVPLLNPDGSPNFNGVKFWERRGEQNQEPIDGFDDIETPYNVATELKSTTPKTLQIDNDDADRVRIIMEFPRLVSTDKEDGDIYGAEVKLQFQLAVGNDSFKPVIPVDHKDSMITVAKKSSGKFLREYFIDLPKPGKNYRIRIFRYTPDSSSDYLHNKTIISSYGEIVFAKMGYPNSAVVGVTIDSREFGGNMPRRSYLVSGMKIRVPSNYIPTENTYQGDWDGGFDIQVSSNPAWILYDLLTNKRYGLGNFVNESMIDRGQFYQIGRYCDQEVPDGFGGTEKRFTINTVIANRQEAYKVISDIASVFRGMVFWAGGMINLRQDSPSTPVMQFSAANIIDKIVRKGSSRKDRPTVAVVTYNDKDDLYKQNVEYIEDEDAKKRFGIRKTESLAFGCTSRGQAYRTGLWLLYTSKMETDVITFKAGIDSSFLVPGELVKLQDKYRSGKRNSGRIKSFTKNSITLDAPVKLDKEGAFITYLTTDSRMIDRNLLEPTGEYQTVTFKEPINTGDEPMEMGIWTITEPDLEPVLIRVLSVREGDEKGTFEITGVEHNPSKFEAIDRGAILIPPKTSVLDPTFSKPTGLEITEATYLSSPGNLSVKLIVSWEGRSPKYVLRYRRSDVVDNWVRMELTDNQCEILNVVDSARYDIEVFAISITGRKTETLAATYTTLGTLMPPGAPKNLAAVGDYRQIVLTWVNPDAIDLETIYVYGSRKNNFETASLLAKIPSTTFTHSGLDDDVTWYYWVRAVNKRGMLSPVNTNLGTSATTKDILSFLRNKITSSELGKELLEELDAKAVSEDLEAIQDLVDKSERKIGSIQDLVDVSEKKISSIQDSVDVSEKKIEAIQDLFEESDKKIHEIDKITYEIKASQEILNSSVETVKENAKKALQDSDNNASKIVKIKSTVDEQDKKIASTLEAIQTVKGGMEAVLFEEKNSRIEADKATTEKVELIETKIGSHDAAIKRAESTAIDAGKTIARVTGSVEAVAKAAIDTALKGEEEVREQRDTNAKIFTDQKVIVDGQQALSQKIETMTAEFNQNIKAQLNEEKQTRASADEALSKQVTQLTSEINQNIKAQLSEEKQARANADEALSKQVTQLKSEVDQNIKAQLHEEKQTRASADEALSKQVIQLKSNVDQSIKAQLHEEKQTRASADEALSKQIRQLKTDVDQNVKAQLNEEKQARANADEALSKQVTQLKSDIGQNITAQLNEEKQARANAEGALSKQITQLKSEVDQNIKAQLSEEKQTRTNADEALSRQVTQLKSEVSQSITTQLNEEKQTRTNADEALSKQVIQLKSEVDKNIKAQLHEEKQTRTNADEALSRQVTLLKSEINTSVNALLNEEKQTRANSDEALSKQMTQLKSEVNQSIAAQLNEEKQTRANADESLSKQIIQLRSEVGTDIKSQLDEEKKTRATKDEALSQSVERLKAQTSKDIEAAVLAEKNARTTADKSLADSVNVLSAKTQKDIASAVSNEATARASKDDALAGEITKVLAKTNANEAAVKAEQTARANSDSALGNRIDTVQAKVNENAAIVQQTTKTVADINGKISASWNLKVETTKDGKKYAAGMALGVNNNASQFLVQADRFGLINVNNGTVTTPFVVENGTTYMNAAYIKDGSISSGKVGDLQSDNYSSGKTGWRFGKNGQLEMNGQTSGQGRLNISNNRIDVYDEKGVLRVRIGLL
ncbi:phage tail protein [Xenorhabdus sp. KJ12.1]|uniref:phage tail tip fiber protein n=1 Tax=Xenorhabdus sp. KJ12.1 TaxID=1851571 RepID=UPI000C061CA5|nr:phage tail protein [Xenorhabdus sp. KJ12.1]PHM69462.1 host specificity protein J [Xenorhabdus sp. KJ12.1]